MGTLTISQHDDPSEVARKLRTMTPIELVAQQRSPSPVVRALADAEAELRVVEQRRRSALTGVVDPL